MSDYKSWKAPIQITRKYSDGVEYITRASANQLKPYFGVNEGAKWSADGHHKRVVEGVIMWVNPLAEKYLVKTPYGTRWKRDGFHTRLMCVCPECGHELTYGRLHQHMRIHAS